MFHHLIFVLSILLLLSCSPAFNLTDRSGNAFVIKSAKLEHGGNLEYKTGDATRELKIKDIVSLSLPEPDPKFIDSKVFYPATLTLEDSVSVPTQGFICVEDTLIAKNAGRDFSIPLANIKELNRQKKK